MLLSIFITYLIYKLTIDVINIIKSKEVKNIVEPIAINEETISSISLEVLLSEIGSIKIEVIL